jgi:DNA (cytosine-5)-methyltransferase 1
MKVLSLFSGIGAFEKALTNLGVSFDLVNYCEIDKYASRSYSAIHGIYEGLNLWDIKTVDVEKIPNVDLITYGFPCQDISVAGKQAGMNEGTRSSLYYEALKIIKGKRPKYAICENVKNLTTHDGGRTFRIVLDALTDLGYHIKYKIMNAYEYSAIPQNRERIYIVGFRSKKNYNNFEFPEKTNLKLDLSKYIDFESKIEDNFYYTDKYMSKQLIKEMTNKNTVYQWRRQYVRENKSGLCPTLTANMGTGGHNVPLVLTKYGIRKLTPKECFNLMGFPKSFKLPLNVSNGNLYKQAGNAVVVPVIRRIAVNIRKAMEA